MSLKGLAALFPLFFIVLFISCTKINEATDLGGDLIPAVDNVNTFDTTLEVEAAHFLYDDTTRYDFNSNMALGKINDVVFGPTTADMYIGFSNSLAYGSYPFLQKDSVKGIDSVVLSLSYRSGYGDTATAAGTQISVQVNEILPNNAFRNDSLYRYTNAGFTTGTSYGTRSFTFKDLTDSIPVLRKGDTTKPVNVLRIRLNNSLGDKLRSFDTIANTVNGGYATDSIFRTLFRGLAIKTNSAGGQGALAYFNLLDANTKLIVYYRVGRSTGIDSGASVTYIPYRSDVGHFAIANTVTRTPGGEYLAKLGNKTSDKLYLQSSSSGSYIGINIPGLSGFPNKVIHRAEIIAYKVPSTFDDKFTVPNLLLLDHQKSGVDSSYIFERDLQVNTTGTGYDFATFGGIIKTDNSYHFNITRYVQGLVTRKERNDSLRLYAPLQSKVYSGTTAQFLTVLDNVVKGRVVIANRNYADQTKRLRLHIIYSNL